MILHTFNNQGFTSTLNVFKQLEMNINKKFFHDNVYLIVKNFYDKKIIYQIKKLIGKKNIFPAFIFMGR